MKKLTILLFALCCVIVAMACGGTTDDEVDGTTGATEQTGGDGGSANGKMLVVYFSRAGENWQVGVVERGNTAIMADYIQELLRLSRLLPIHRDMRIARRLPRRSLITILALPSRQTSQICPITIQSLLEAPFGGLVRQ